MKKRLPLALLLLLPGGAGGGRIVHELSMMARGVLIGVITPLVG
jgi:hypothetical protein